MASRVVRKGSYPWLTLIQDQKTRAAMKTMADQIAAVRTQLETLDVNALKVGSPVNAQRQRVANAADPQQAQDLVTLATLRRHIASAIERLRAEFSDGDPSNGEGGGGAPGGGEDPDLPLPDMSEVVADMAAAFPTQFANSCGNTEWLEMLILELRTYDTRFGLNWKRGVVGDLSEDVVNYYYGPEDGEMEESRLVYTVDVIGGHCGPSPTPAWNTVGIGPPGMWTSAGVF